MRNNSWKRQSNAYLLWLMFPDREYCGKNSYGTLSAANCRSLDSSAAAETYLDFLTNYQNRDYTITVRKTHYLLDNLRVVLNA